MSETSFGFASTWNVVRHSVQKPCGVLLAVTCWPRAMVATSVAVKLVGSFLRPASATPAALPGGVHSSSAIRYASTIS
jgi:hypothetical protein